MTTFNLDPDQAAVVVNPDGKVEIFLPKEDDEAMAGDAHVVATMMVWAASQRDIRERFEAILALQ